MMIHGVAGTNGIRNDDLLEGTDGNDVLFGGLDRSIYYESPLTEPQVREALQPFHDSFISGIPSYNPLEKIDGYTEEEWGQFVDRAVFTTRTDWTAPFGDVPASPPGNGWREVGSLSNVAQNHPGGDQDFRRVVADVQLGDTGQTAKYGQQAIYDDGRLITHGPGAGTVDLQAPGMIGWNRDQPGNTDHAGWDELPFRILGWELYHQLGWTPHREWPSNDATEYWGQDGDDLLEGSRGNDTYGFITGGGHDIISDIGNIGDKEDTLQIYGGGPIDNIGQDLKFSVDATGNNLEIGITGTSDTATIIGMNNPAAQVEQLDLLRGNEVIDTISLLQKYEELNPDALPPPPPTLTPQPPTPVAPGHLANTSWSVSATDEAGNSFNGTKLYFTKQTSDDDGSGYDLEGSFNWNASNGSYGKETFIGELEGHELKLAGQSIVQPATGLVTATYTGTLSEDGYLIENGQMSGDGGIPGQWSAAIDLLV